MRSAKARTRQGPGDKDIPRGRQRELSATATMGMTAPPGKKGRAQSTGHLSCNLATGNVLVAGVVGMAHPPAGRRAEAKAMRLAGKIAMANVTLPSCRLDRGLTEGRR